MQQPLTWSLLHLSPDNHVVYETHLHEPARDRPIPDLDGRVYLIGETGLHAVEPDGTAAWSRPLPAKFCQFFIRPDGSLPVHGRNPDMPDPVVLRSYARDGKQVYDYTFQSETTCIPVTSIDGEIIVTDGTRLRFLDESGSAFCSDDSPLFFSAPPVSTAGCSFRHERLGALEISSSPASSEMFTLSWDCSPPAAEPRSPAAAEVPRS